jgi:hypothetical protein
MNTWKHFERVAKTKLEAGQKSLIPVVGSGFNLQASRDSSNWISLLSDIGRELGLSGEYLEITKLSRMSATATWEYFITKVAFSKGRSASDIESKLKKIVQEKLKEFETEPKHPEFYRAFLDMGFRDIISLNFDRTLSLQGKHKLANANEGGNPDYYKNYRRHSVTLFRHINVKPRRTRLWYPHGDTGKFDTIKLGIREYGIYIKSIEEAIQAYIKTWIGFLEEEGFNFFQDPEIFDMGKYCYYWKLWCEEVRHYEPLNWVWLFISAPVVFLGCGLSSDEWPMWWLLHQRARLFARLPEEKREPVFVFWNVGDQNNIGTTQWFQKRPADIILLPCNDWVEGWHKVLEVLS